jgi:hypothetical protein
MQKQIKFIDEQGQHCILKVNANGSYTVERVKEKTTAERVLDYKEIYRAQALDRLCSEVCARSIVYKKG